MPEPTTAATTAAADQQVIQQATTGTTATTQPTEFTYTFKDGRTIKANSQNELVALMGDRYENLFGHTETLKGENANFRQSVSNLVNNQTQQTNGYSQEKYLEIWTKDPLAAQQYLNSYDPQLNAAVSQLEQIEWDRQSQAFLAANDDFKKTPENIQLLSSVSEKMYPGVKTINANQMEAAHLYCQKHKLYGDTTVTQTTATVPPVPPASTTTQNDNAPDITKMNQDQLRAYIESVEKQQRQA